MSDFNVEYDVNAIEQTLQSLGDRELIHKILMKATSDASTFLQKEAKQALMYTIPTANVHNPQHENRWYNWSKPMTDGIKKDKMKYGEGYYVSILPDARNIWMENGTKNRMTKGRKISGYAQTTMKVYRTDKSWYQRTARTVDRKGQGHSTGKIEDGKFTFFNPMIQREGDSAINRIKSSVEEALKKYGVE